MQTWSSRPLQKLWINSLRFEVYGWQNSFGKGITSQHTPLLWKRQPPYLPLPALEKAGLMHKSTAFEKGLGKLFGKQPLGKGWESLWKQAFGKGLRKIHLFHFFLVCTVFRKGFVQQFHFIFLQCTVFVKGLVQPLKKGFSFMPLWLYSWGLGETDK